MNRQNWEMLVDALSEADAEALELAVLARRDRRMNAEADALTVLPEELAAVHIVDGVQAIRRRTGVGLAVAHRAWRAAKAQATAPGVTGGDE